MVADPGLLVEHDAVLRQGADAVIGHIPLHPDSPRTLLSSGVEQWARERHERLLQTRGQLSLGDLLTGQLSVRRDVFERAAGFDESFNARGEFGAEDTDFLHRLLRSGGRGALRARCGDLPALRRHAGAEPAAVAAGRSGGRRPGEEASGPAPGAPGGTPRRDAQRPAARPLGARGALPPGPGDGPSRRGPCRFAVDRPAHRVGLHQDPGRVLLARGGQGRRVRSRRPRTGGPGLPRRGEGGRPRHRRVVRHAGTAGAARRRVDRGGFTFVSLEDVLGAGPLPPRSVLLTFDDGYTSLLDGALPVTAPRGIPAVVFVVSGQLGGSNRWDAERGAVELPLLDVDQLRRLVGEGWSLSVHTATHPHLTQQDAAGLDRELVQSLRDLRATGLPIEPVLAFPFGEHDVRVRSATRRAGYTAAFALEGPRGPGGGATPGRGSRCGAAPARRAWWRRSFGRRGHRWPRCSVTPGASRGARWRGCRAASAADRADTGRCDPIGRTAPGPPPRPGTPGRCAGLPSTSGGPPGPPWASLLAAGTCTRRGGRPARGGRVRRGRRVDG
jgi:peptidoglycan/xylan/chitin deacetylase (PgdA/CDA1 family)